MLKFSRFSLLILSVLTCSASLMGCSGLDVRPSGKAFSPLTQQCSAKPTADGCWQAFEQASKMRDSASAGQALLGYAQTQSANKKTWLTLGLWLNPSPWLPAGLKWSEKELEANLPKDTKRGGTLLFASSSAQNGIVSPVTWKQLPAEDKHKLATLISAANQSRGFVSPDQPTMVHVSTPTLRRLNKMAIILPNTLNDSIDLVARADHALAMNQPIDAYNSMSKALDPLEENKECDVKAPLLYAHGVLNHGLYNGGLDQNKDELKTLCAEKPSKSETSVFIRIVLDLEMGGSEDNILETLTATGVDTYRAKIKKLSASLTAEQRSYTDFLWRRMLITRDLYPKLQCTTKRPKATREINDLVESSYTQSRPLMAFYFAHQTDMFKVGEGEEQKLNIPTIIKTRKRLESHRLHWTLPTFYAETLATVKPTAPVMIRLNAEPICKAYSDELARQMDKDRSEGFEGRAMTRVMAWSGLNAQCLNKEMYEALVKKTISALKASPKGRISFLTFFGYVSIHALTGILDGRINQTLAVVQTMMPELQKFKASLGNSDEDRILHDLIMVIQTIRGDQLKRLQPALQKLSDTLDGVLAKSTKKTDPPLVKHAPVLRLITRHAMVVFAGMTNPSKVPGYLKRVENTLNSDLKRALYIFEQPASLVAPIESHLKVIYRAAIVIMMKKDAKALKNALATAQQTKSNKWWRLAFGSVTSMGWGVMAYHNHEKKQPVARSAALLASRKQLGAMLDGLIKDFDVTGTNWELMRLLVPIHEFVGETLIKSDGKEVDWSNEMLKSVSKVEVIGKSLLQSLEQQTKTNDANARPNFVNMFMDLTRASFNIGLKNLYDEKKKDIPKPAREALSRALDKQLGQYSPALKVYAHTLQAVLLYDDEAAVKAKLQKANAITQKHPGSYMYLPLLVTLRMNRNGWANPKEALKKLQDTVAEQKKIKRTCPSQHLKALLPQEAKLLDLVGQHKKALLARRRFMLATDKDFVGETVLSCQINASRGLVKANVNLSFPITSLTFEKLEDEDAKNLSTFQVGFGIGSVTDNSENINCSISSPATKQYARIYQATLEQALMALYKRDKAYYQEALGRLMYMNAMFLGVQPALLPNEMKSLSTERTKIDLAMLRWVIVLAQSRGQWQTARNLQGDYTKLRTMSTSPAKADKTPAMVTKIKPLLALQPIVDGLHISGKKSIDWKKLSVTAKKLENEALKPEERLLLLTANAGMTGNMDAAKVSFGELVKIKKHSYMSIVPTLGFSISPKQYNMQKQLTDVIQQMRQEKQNLEMTLLLSETAPSLTKSKQTVQFLADIYKTLGNNPTWHQARYKLATTILSESKLLTPKQVVAIYQQWLKDGYGAIPWNKYIGYKYQFAQLLISQKRYKLALATVTQMTQTMTRAYPITESVMIDLLALELSLRIEQKMITMPAVLAFLDLAKKTKNVSMGTQTILAKYRGATSQAEWRDIAIKHLQKR